MYRRDFLQFSGGWLLTSTFTPFLKKAIQVTELIPQPKWTNWPKIRNVNNPRWGKIRNDTESHLQSGHIYGDNDHITASHEESHGIASNIRNKANSGQLTNTILLPHNQTFELKIPVQSGGRKNGFYCLNNQAVIIQEPNTHIRSVAQLVPRSLQGGTYQLYLVSQAGSWGDTPLYIFDENIGYVNGSECRLDLKIKSRAETLKFAIEFIVYSSCVPWASKSNDPQLRNFFMWNTYRVRWLYDNSVRQLGEDQSALNYIKTMQNSSDAENWRQFMRNYCGKEYCKYVLGF